MLFVNIGGDPKRTEDFMSQARERETRDVRMYNWTENFGELDGNKITARNEEAFYASGQTIRSSYIPHSLAKRIITSSVPERLNDITEDETKIGFTADVKNVDITKSHNQFGVGGETLQQLKQEIAKSGVRQGLTYNNRSRSEPNIQLRRTG